jgi:hypothetical protein
MKSRKFKKYGKGFNWSCSARTIAAQPLCSQRGPNMQLGLPPPARLSRAHSSHRESRSRALQSPGITDRGSNCTPASPPEDKTEDRLESRLRPHPPQSIRTGSAFAKPPL